MSGYMGDLTNYLYGTTNTAAASKGTLDTSGKADEARTSLDMTDFLTLMVTELTHQSMDQTADTSDMLNQMVQMQMVQALTNMTDASIMTYAASLVGKEVTVGQYDGNGELQEIVGQVTGTGTMGGEQVVFVNDKYYYMNEIMAVGRLPKTEEVPEENGGEAVEGTDQVEGGENAGGDLDSETDEVEGTNGTESGGDVSGEPGENGETAAGTPEATAV